ncbi:MAG TPA: hypothetical protein VG274_10880 [Rhizomicrobium sp.]|jgi:hypothetical protein|nr:hypothetical protein [Rhizomicrobium sp.]
MRLDVLTCAFLLAAIPATARPLATPKPLPPAPRPLLDLSGLKFFHEQQPSDSGTTGSPAGTGAQWSGSRDVTGLSLGPLRAQVGADDKPRDGLQSYELQGMDLLGNAMSKNNTGQTAKLLFVWPTDQ